MLFFSAEDLACRNPKAGYLILGDDVAWEDFYAHMKIKACDQLFPNQPVVDNNSFDMNFTIARHVPIALSLASAADYAHLLTNALKIKKNPTVKVSLNSRAPNLVRESSELVFRQSYNEYPLQEPGKENIPTPAAPIQDDGHPNERCDVSLTRETTNTKHIQAERGSMTEQCDPHKISVGDTN